MLKLLFEFPIYTIGDNLSIVNQQRSRRFKKNGLHTFRDQKGLPQFVIAVHAVIVFLMFRIPCLLFLLCLGLILFSYIDLHSCNRIMRYGTN